MTVAFQRRFGILERWYNNQVTPSISKPHELSYRSNNMQERLDTIFKTLKLTIKICNSQCAEENETKLTEERFE